MFIFCFCFIFIFIFAIFVLFNIFEKGAHYALEELADSDYDVISLDWTMDPQEARKRVQGKVALQGNLDSSIFFASNEIIKHHSEIMVM